MKLLCILSWKITQLNQEKFTFSFYKLGFCFLSIGVITVYYVVINIINYYLFIACNSVTRSLSLTPQRLHDETKDAKEETPRMQEFKKKLREKTPIGKLDEIQGKHPYQEKEPLEAFPNNINPKTGEVGGKFYLIFRKYSFINYYK